jgi:hypothetical protein
VNLPVKNENGEDHEIKLTNVIYLPEMENKLISGGKIAMSGAETVLKDDAVLVLKKGSLRVSDDAEVLLQGRRREDGLYEILPKIDKDVLDQFILVNVQVNKVNISSKDIHLLFGHMSLQWIKSSKSIMECFSITDDEECNCNVCGVRNLKERNSKESEKRN